MHTCLQLHMNAYRYVFIGLLSSSVFLMPVLRYFWDGYGSYSWVRDRSTMNWMLPR
jgi:hypothetical protein